MLDFLLTVILKSLKIRIAPFMLKTKSINVAFKHAVFTCLMTPSSFSRIETALFFSFTAKNTHRDFEELDLPLWSNLDVYLVAP